MTAAQDAKQRLNIHIKRGQRKGVFGRDWKIKKIIIKIANTPKGKSEKERVQSNSFFFFYR